MVEVTDVGARRRVERQPSDRLGRHRPGSRELEIARKLPGGRLVPPPETKMLVALPLDCMNSRSSMVMKPVESPTKPTIVKLELFGMFITLTCGSPKMMSPSSVMLRFMVTVALPSEIPAT